MTRIALTLVSHTNAGKTTLARTLLGRDVGEVRDAPHVTDAAEAWPVVEHGDDALVLWDTPGFGDSARLLARLRGASNPIGWFLAELWDRWRDRPFWASQQALRAVRAEADVVLYLVNASESPEAAGYVRPEMALLAWIGKPVIVLLNQMGAPRAPQDEAAEVERWRRHLADQPLVRDVLPLDAFARCWVQEGALWDAVQRALDDGARRDAMARLHAAWQAQRRSTFDTAMRALAASLARMALMREPLPEGPRLRERLVRLGVALGLGRSAGGERDDAAALAQRALLERLHAELRDGTAELVRLHGLGHGSTRDDGAALREVLRRTAAQYELRLKVDEGRAALIGGALTGALAGLKADIASGGLTLGGGLLAGGLLGALGAAGLARGVNLVRGQRHSWAAWSADALDQAVEAALLRYLAVAHFGRGRGDWVASESPPHWREVVQAALAPQREAFAAAWRERAIEAPDVGAPGDASDVEARDDEPDTGTRGDEGEGADVARAGLGAAGAGIAGAAGADEDTATAAGRAREPARRLAALLQPLLAQAAAEALESLYPGHGRRATQAAPAVPGPPAPPADNPRA